MLDCKKVPHFDPSILCKNCLNNLKYTDSLSYIWKKPFAEKSLSSDPEKNDMIRQDTRSGSGSDFE